MKIIYICDFDLTKSSGKDRATRQKVAALADIVNDFKLFNITNSNRFIRVLFLPWLELKVSLWIVLNRPDAVISRGNVGLIFQRVAKLLNIRSVREIHSDSIGEVVLLPCSDFKKYFIKQFLLLNNMVDKYADIRIFNNPLLQIWYQKTHSKEGNYSFYNGYDPQSKSDMSRTDAIKKFGLSEGFDYLVFVGSASKWHGAEYLVNLQNEFDRCGDKVKVVCGGGSLGAFDKEGVCINFTPLDEYECADLIRAASACLLPVKMNRVSPGSPLKLYDYIANKRYVVTYKGIVGYSDEVERLGVGVSVNFDDVKDTRVQILSLMSKVKKMNDLSYPQCDVTWKDRMDEWITCIENLENLCFFNDLK